MDTIIITIESDDPDLLQQELTAARDHEEGITIRTGGDAFTVDVLSVSRRTIPSRPLMCGCDWHSGVPGSRPDDHDRFHDGRE